MIEVKLAVPVPEMVKLEAPLVDLSPNKVPKDLLTSIFSVDPLCITILVPEGMLDAFTVWFWEMYVCPQLFVKAITIKKKRKEHFNFLILSDSGKIVLI